jgi:hypothetical protein
MKLILQRTLYYLAVVALVASPSFSRAVKAFDLNGRWKCNDGAIYEIHQSGNHVSWDGLAPGFHNKFYGVIYGKPDSPDGPLVLGIWRDVEGRMNHGILSLFIIDENTLNRHSQEGNFSGSVWQRVVHKPSPEPFGEDNVGKPAGQ